MLFCFPIIFKLIPISQCGTFVDNGYFGNGLIKYLMTASRIRGLNGHTRPDDFKLVPTDVNC